MDWDEASSQKKPVVKDLAPLGVRELNAYIGDLKSEISRAEAEITKRESTKSAADSFFKKV